MLFAFIACLSFRYCSSATTEKQRLHWVETLNENKICDLICHMWRKMQEPVDFLTVRTRKQISGNCFLQKSDGQVTFLYHGFEYMWSMQWNGTDCSKALCITLAKAGLLEVNTGILKRKDFEPAVIYKDKTSKEMNKPQNLSSDMQQTWIVKAILGIMHNCLRFHPTESKQRLRKSDLLKVTKQAQFHFHLFQRSFNRISPRTRPLCVSRRLFARRT